MAKGNLFLGMGRGSVGDVTFYRADGQQLSRARNRKPRNPKTNAQLIQRAISATVVQAYKAGCVIFDHSFEGKSVPAGSQRAFLSTNMRKLREQILREIDAATPSETVARVVSPRSIYPVPNTFRISEGSLIQNLFTVDMNGDDKICAIPVTATQGETVAQYLSRLGISEGEIFTICTFGTMYDANFATTLVSGQCTFGFMRLTVKESAINLQTAVSAAHYQDVFTIDSAGAVLPSSKLLTSGITIDEVDFTGTSYGSIGVIRSNENSGLRSTSDMGTPNSFDPTSAANSWGVWPNNLLASWSQDSGSVDSELILEGGDI